MRYSALVLMIGLAGCAAPKPAEPPPSEETVETLLAHLRDPNPTRRQVAVSWLADLGPRCVPTLRGILTRREGVPDPSILASVRALRSDSDAVDRLLEAGKKAAPELWETVFTSSSPELVLKCVEILTLMEGLGGWSLPLVEILMSWGSLPAYRAPTEARVEPIRAAESRGRFGKLVDDFSLKKLDEETENVIFFPEAKEEDHQDPADR